jgi:hypothetical protein
MSAPWCVASSSIWAEGACLFEREHHRRIARVLESLDAESLLSRQCLFGGGNAIALRHGEYRESVDIDFIISNLEGYRQLRQALTGPDGLGAVTREGTRLVAARDIRADQYGIRTMVRVDAVDIKLEIVLEARITLDAPGAEDRVCGVATLTPRDLVATKLLANSDRWADDAVASRDLIDLAMMEPGRELLRLGIAKASQAYGQSIATDLGKAIEQLRQRPLRLGQCMARMGMTGLPKALLWQRIKALRP